CVDYVRARSLHYFYFHRSSTTQIYTLSLHDALPIYQSHIPESNRGAFGFHTEIALSLGRLADAVDELTVDGQFDRAVDANHIIRDRKSTRLNSSHVKISYAVFCLKKKKQRVTTETAH